MIQQLQKGKTICFVNIRREFNIAVSLIDQDRQDRQSRYCGLDQLGQVIAKAVLKPAPLLKNAAQRNQGDNRNDRLNRNKK